MLTILIIFPVLKRKRTGVVSGLQGNSAVTNNPKNKVTFNTTKTMQATASRENHVNFAPPPGLYCTAAAYRIQDLHIVL
jgi:hypothetical protein